MLLKIMEDRCVSEQSDAQQEVRHVTVRSWSSCEKSVSRNWDTDREARSKLTNR